MTQQTLLRQSQPPTVTEDTLQLAAAAYGADAIGWFENVSFPAYLKTLSERQSEYDFQYRSNDTFLHAANINEKYVSVIVLLKDYFMQKASDRDGLKLSNYSRFCWQTVDPLTVNFVTYLQYSGYIAESIDIPKRAAACLAGLGGIGMNSMFYAYGLGSYVGIATIGTNIPLANRNKNERVCLERCSSCGLCTNVCPTSAIVGQGYAIYPKRCISFMNRHPDEPVVVQDWHIIQQRGWLHGCEDCQDCCPMNQIEHKMNVVCHEKVNLSGLSLMNRPEVDREEVLLNVDNINEIGYRRYIHKLLSSLDEK